MATPVNGNEPSPHRSESRGITTAAMLLLAAGIGLLALESCTQAPEPKTKEPAATDVKDVKAPASADVKAPDAKDTPKPPDPPKPADLPEMAPPVT